MDLPGFIEDITSLAENHTAIVIALVLCLFFFVYRKPKLFFSLLLFGLLMVGLFYMITNLVGSGSEQKRKLIHEEAKQSGSTP